MNFSAALNVVLALCLVALGISLVIGERQARRKSQALAKALKDQIGSTARVTEDLMRAEARAAQVIDALTAEVADLQSRFEDSVFRIRFDLTDARITVPDRSVMNDADLMENEARRLVDSFDRDLAAKGLVRISDTKIEVLPDWTEYGFARVIRVWCATMPRLQAKPGDTVEWYGRWVQIEGEG